MLKKILKFIDGAFSDPKEIKIELGVLYKIKGEDLPFRYIRYAQEPFSTRPIYRFKHHQLKEYKFHDLLKVQRKANPEEIRIYNLVKDHVNKVAEDI